MMDHTTRASKRGRLLYERHLYLNDNYPAIDGLVVLRACRICLLRDSMCYPVALCSEFNLNGTEEFVASLSPRATTFSGLSMRYE